jgi:hypothetical protein
MGGLATRKSLLWLKGWFDHSNNRSSKQFFLLFNVLAQSGLFIWGSRTTPCSEKGGLITPTAHLYSQNGDSVIPTITYSHFHFFFLMCRHELNGLFKMNGQLNNIAPCNRLKWLGIIIYTTLAKEQGSQLFFFSFKKKRKEKKKKVNFI